MNDNATSTAPTGDQRRPISPLTTGLTIGFATVASMWTLGYLLRFPGLSTPPVAIGIALLTVQAIAAVLGGALGPARASVRVGLLAGLTTGLLNLLILGSMLFEDSGSAAGDRPSPVVIILGWIAFSLVLGVVGVWIGALIWPAPGRRDQSRGAWLGRFAVVSALTMLPLLLVGGVVTTSDSGMAVPDWPNTFGSNMFLFPLSRMTGGVYFEHTHRLFGALVGLTSLTLMVLTLRSERDSGAKRLAVVIFVCIVAQGILGGTRVTETSRALALAHGVFAQGIFALLVVLGAMLSARWNDGSEPMPGHGFRRLRRIAIAALVMVLIQIALGGMIRHFSGEKLAMHAVLTHAGFSLVVFGHVAAVGGRLTTIKGAPKPLHRLGVILLGLVSLQMLLGVVALGVAMMHQNRAEAPTIRLVIGATHQTVGALVLGGVALALAWIRHSLVEDGSTKQTASE